ncbi:Lytic transglycosylase catalytic [Delftia sp. Cs1-4]|uniref:lytic transglycosylase domain-containing protein n=1 Tax=Delftia sp. (strain Cs1-4) TaxID=742013 RepID=UPI00020E7A75|nr:lytic transglycosylase domain-containing protein [Delftia sp. Cs1-4]AEF88729.1 Lytic transglycosylase catalytic [Delftia sp. Cs1-4]
MRPLPFTAALLLIAMPVAACACWDAAAQRYGVSAQLLYAVARVESGLNPRAVNDSHRARTGTRDIGLMQINSSHLPKLARYGISEADLYDPCTNMQVGAWLLAESFARHGITWNAVGAYNAACSQLKGDACTRARSDYAWKVYRRLPQAPAAAAPRVTAAAPAAPAALRSRARALAEVTP